jgi:hypothetical protein
VATALFLCAWLACLADWVWAGVLSGGWLGAVRWSVFLAAGAIAVAWAAWARTQPSIMRAAIWTGSYVLVWHTLVFVSHELVWDQLRAYVSRGGLAGLFVIGLCWVVWLVEQGSRRYASRRRAGDADRAGLAFARRTASPERRGPRTWNPLDLEAWYYGRRARKLNQSLTALATYTLAFFVAVLLLGQISGCREIYEMPAGGGEQKAIAVQTVKLQKVIKKKFVINPFSAIIFNPPPIDDVKLQLTEITQHAYTVGYGQGQGAGFSGGTARGKVRFIRLEYAGGDWNQDFGVGADLNMLIQYGVRTSHPVHNQTESRTVAQLGNFVPGKSPPLVYLTGQRSISLSKSEIKTLREYLLDQHGMLFGDNGGSAHFHNQFFAMMRQVLPNGEPVRVPLDDVIHRVPFHLPFLPYVAPHGGKDAWGWKVDGRWVCYYHPGDIGDAWTDDHSGVPPEIWEACYQLGTNVIFYAHVEYNKWLDARQVSKQ